MKKVTLNRKELYDLVWSTPLTKIAEKYQISIPEIKEACTTLKVPLPSSGYWTKLHLGQNVSSTELVDEKIENNEIEFIERIEVEKMLKGISPELQIYINEIESTHSKELIVPDKLINPDSLIEDARKSLQAQNKDFHGAFLTNRDELDIHVTKDNVMRALLFMDTLIKLFKKRGHSFTVSNGSPIAMIYGEKIKLFLREKMNRILTDDRWNRHTYTATGILYLKVEIDYFVNIEWKDGKEPLENKLSIIIAKIELKVKEGIEENRLKKIEYEKREVERKKKQAIEDREKKEESDFKSILEEARIWKKIEIATDYINRVEKSIIESGKIDDKVSQRILMMRKRLEQFDPMKNSKLLSFE